MLGIGIWELLLVLVIVLVVFGPSKLPELGKSIGKGLREFKKATGEIAEEMKKPDEADKTATKASETKPEEKDKADKTNTPR